MPRDALERDSPDDGADVDALSDSIRGAERLRAARLRVVPVSVFAAAAFLAMPPTRAEIASGLGFSTPSSAEDHLQALARKGAIDMIPGAWRGLRLKEWPGVPIQGTLPLVGRVAAGHPILAVENIEAHYRVDPALFSPRADYLLRVRGESMRDAGLLDGDLLAVHRTREARNGQVVVARIGSAAGDEVTVKRLRKRGRDIVLLPENPAFDPIVVDPRTAAFAIEGVAVGLVRSGGW